MKVVKNNVQKNMYTISMNRNRKENREFIDEYNIRNDKQKQILLNLKVTDFCYSVRNHKEGYEHEILYVFAPQVELYDSENIKSAIDIYIKINILNTNNGIIIISFHKMNKPIERLFGS